jgi:hypothetical protein
MEPMERQPGRRADPPRARRAFVVRFNWHKSPPEFHVDPVMAPMATARKKGKV